MNRAIAVWRITSIVLCALFFTNASFADNGKARRERRANAEAKNQLEQVLRKYFAPSNYQISEVTAEGKSVSGTVSFFSKPGVNLSASLNEDNSFQSIKVEFPPDTRFEARYLNKITPQGKNLRDVLPSLNEDAGVIIKDFLIQFQPGQNELQSFETNLESSSWDFMSYGALKMEKVTLNLKVNPSGGASPIGGEIRGDIKLGQESISVSATIPQNKEDFVLKGSFKGSSGPVKLANLIKSIGGDEMLTEVSQLIPRQITDPVLNAIEIPNFDFTANPSLRKFELNSSSSIGTTHMEVDATRKMVFQYQPNTNFRFGDLSPDLAWMDQDEIKLSNIDLSIASATFQDKKGKKVKPGFTVAGDIEPARMISKSDGEKARFRILGSMDTDGVMRLELDNKINIPLGNGVEFQNANLFLESTVAPPNITAGFDGSIIIPADDNTKLLLKGGLNGRIPSLQFTGSFLVSALNGDKQAGEWVEPFGIPYFSFVKLGAGLSLNPATIIGGVGFTGVGKFGRIPAAGAPDKRVTINIDTLALNIITPLDSEIKLSLENTTVAGIIEAFEPNANLGELRKLLDTGIEQGYLEISPRTKTFKGGGDFKLMNFGSHLDFAFEKTSGFSMNGWIDPIVIESGGFTFFAVKGAQGPRPNFAMSFTGNPSFRIDGAVELMGMLSTSTFINIDQSGFQADATGKLFNGALAATVKVRGKNPVDSRDISVEVIMQNEVNNAVKNSLVAFIKNQAKDSDKKIREAQTAINNAKSGSDDFSKFWMDGADGFLTGINAIQGEMATAGVLITKGVFESMDVREIRFKGTLKDTKINVNASIEMLVFGKKTIYHADIALDSKDLNSTADLIAAAIGNDILKGFSYLGAELESLGGELEEFGQNFVAAWGTVGAEMEQQFNNMAAGFEKIAEEVSRAAIGPEYPGGKSGAPMTALAPGMRHYTVRVNSIKVLAVSDGTPPPSGSDAGSSFLRDVGKTFDSATGAKTQTGHLDAEMWGAITVKAGNNVTTTKGTNSIAWSRNRNQNMPTRANQSITSYFGPQKHFYARANSGATVEIRSLLEEQDDGAYFAEDEHFTRNGLIVYLDRLRDGGNDFNFVTTAGNTKAQIFFTVTADRMMTVNDFVAAARSGNPNQIKEVIRLGGDIKAAGPQTMSAAVSSGKMEVVNFLLANNINPSPQDLSTALRNNQQDMAQKLIIRGVRPSQMDLQTAIQNNNLEMTQIIINHGLAPTIGDFNSALNGNRLPMAKMLIDAGVQPSLTELSTVVTKMDLEATRMIVTAGVAPTPAMISQSLTAKNKAMFDYLMETGTPDYSNLSLAAQQNDLEAFRSITERGIKVQDDIPVQKAIDFNNIQLLETALAYGGNSNSALQYGVSKGNLEAVNTGLSYGADPNGALNFAAQRKDLKLFTSLITTYSARGNDALREAVTVNNYDMAKVAIEMGAADPNPYVQQYGDAGNEQMIHLLVDNGANPSPAMMGTVMKGNVNLLAYLIDNGADVNNATYVQKSSETNNFPMLKLLVDNGADPNPGMSAAVNNNQIKTVEYLLINNANAKGFLSIPASKGDLKFTRLLLEYGADANEGIKGAVDGGHMQVAQYLLDNNASVNGLLMTPSSQGRLDMVQLLVDYGADPNEGMSGAVVAAKNEIVAFLLGQGASAKGFIAKPSGTGNLEMVNMLLDYGADPNNGMQACVENGHINVLNRLIEAGADASKDYFMLTATDRHYAPMIPILVANGGNVNIRNADEESLLHMVCDKKGDAATVIELIKAGANLEDTAGKRAETPLHYAANDGNKNVDIVEILIKAGANVNACDGKGKTVWQRAKGGKVKDLLKAAGAEKKCGG